MKYQPIPIQKGRAKGPVNKIMTAKEAVAKFIHEDCYLGMSVSAAPAAIIWEIIRQRERIKTMDLSITSQIGMSSVLIGSGLIRKIEMGYNWGGIEGEDKVFRRAVEKGIPRPLEVEDYSNFGAAMRWQAGALGLPFMPTKSQLGSDIIKYNPRIKVINDPYNGEPISLVPASKPDVGIMHCARADEIGNVQAYGLYGNTDTLARASKHVIVSVEEIVTQSEIRRMPNLNIIPYYYVDAVVHAPFGAHWRESSFYYHHDLAFGLEAYQEFATKEGFDAWAEKYIHNTKDWDEYCQLVGYERLYRLMQSEHKYQKFGEVR
ncbi:MAG: CoA transferase subunit A [Syntrophomonadaceae bacterium]|nr:CoA transferase subunit A [Syntrophomonadaceae bacterium]